MLSLLAGLGEEIEFRAPPYTHTVNIAEQLFRCTTHSNDKI